MNLKLLLKKQLKKIGEATSDLIANKIVDRKVSKTSQKNNSETNEDEIFRERFIPPELRHKIINDLWLKGENDWLSKI